MAITREQVKAGLRVRVIQNTVCAHKPDGGIELLEAGDIITLNGTVEPTWNDSEYYASYEITYSDGRCSTNVIFVSGLEMVEDEAIVKLCNCTTMQLMTSGCRCGGA